MENTYFCIKKQSSKNQFTDYQIYLTRSKLLSDQLLIAPIGLLVKLYLFRRQKTAMFISKLPKKIMIF